MYVRACVGTHIYMCIVCVLAVDNKRLASCHMCYALIAFRGCQMGLSMQKQAIEFQDRMDNLSELIALFHCALLSQFMALF